MDYPRQLWLEKNLVRLVAVGGMIVAYLLLGPLLVMDEPLAPLTFLQDGLARLGVFVLVLLGLAVVLGAVMLPVRPIAVLITVLLVAGGMSLRSSRLESLLWYRGQDIPMVYLGLMGEVLLLWVLGLLAWGIILAVRRGVKRVRPGWVWSGHVPSVATDLPRGSSPKTAGKAPGAGLSTAGGQRQPGASAAGAVAGYVVVAAVVALVGLVVLLQSDQRKQVAFALVVSLGAGSFVAHRSFGLRREWAAMLPPLLVALVLYGLAMAAEYPNGPLAWAYAPVPSRPLPVDWLTFGAGGALLGLWVSRRLIQEQAVQEGQGT